MTVISFFFSLIMLSKLKNDYHMNALKNTGVWWGAFVGSWIVGSVGGLPFMIILYIIMKNSGALENMRQNNIRRENEEQFRRNQQRHNINFGAPSPQGNQYYNNNQPFNQTYGYAPQNGNYTAAAGRTANAPRFDSSLSYDLPKSQRGREKIVRKFSERYQLNLDKNDIKTIASASYFSAEWASEINAMKQRYNSFYEWLGSGRSWLRIYLTAFTQVEAFSAFSKQETYVFDTFDSIFTDMCNDENMPTEAVIENINRKYLTNFDETTFSLAIAYMEANGRRYKFGAPLLQNIDFELENLARKYEETATSGYAEGGYAYAQPDNAYAQNSQPGSYQGGQTSTYGQGSQSYPYGQGNRAYPGNNSQGTQAGYGQGTQGTPAGSGYGYQGSNNQSNYGQNNSSGYGQGNRAYPGNNSQGTQRTQSGYNQGTQGTPAGSGYGYQGTPSGSGYGYQGIQGNRAYPGNNNKVDKK